MNNEPERLFVGIGTQKSGTSWINRYLQSHPQVALPTGELHYWDVVRPPHLQKYQDLAAIRARRDWWRLPSTSRRRLAARMYRSHDHQGYLARLKIERDDETVLGEITPAYSLCTAATYSEMRGMGYEMRFFMVLRDPWDRLWSGLRHQLRKAGRDDSPEAVVAIFREDCKDGRHLGIARSRYDLTLAELDKAVPASELLVLFYERLFSQDSVDALCRHLGVDSTPSDFDRKVNASPTPRGEAPPEFKDEALAILAPCYRNLNDRFGDRIPTAWRINGDRI